MNCNATESRNTNSIHFIRCIEHSKQLTREKLENQKTGNHNHDCGNCTKLNRTHDSVFTLCTIIICNNWNNTIIQTEYRHKDKTLQFKINTINRNSSHSKCTKNQVDEVSQKRTNRTKKNRRNTYLVDVGNCPTVRSESFYCKFDFFVLCKIEGKGNYKSYNLTKNRCPGSTSNSKFRESQKSKNQKRIKNYICNCTGKLRNHRKHSAACRL